MRLVVVESPFAPPSLRDRCDCVYPGESRNVPCERCRRVAIEQDERIRYIRAALRDCLLRGEAPFASHAIYTLPGVLDDTKPEERKLGMEAGFTWGVKAELIAVYTDLGVSGGMEAGMLRAKMSGIPIEMRSLGSWK